MKGFLSAGAEENSRVLVPLRSLNKNDNANDNGFFKGWQWIHCGDSRRFAVLSSADS